MVLDAPENLRKMEEALRVLEQGGETRVIDLKYAKAIDVESNLKDQLEANKLGFVRADERSNQLIVKTFPDRMRELEELIKALDRKTREVLIDAKIVKVSYTDDLNAGVDWDAVFSNLTFHGVDTRGDFRTSTAGTEGAEVPALTRIRLDPALSKLTTKAQVSGLGDLLLGTVARDGYELMRYLRTIGKTQLISNPRMMVTENQEAKILVGTREAYIISTSTAGTSTTTTAEDVEFIDVGIRLSVTPQINADGYVTMKITPEVSSVVRTLVTGTNQNEIPIVDTSTASTTVMVADGNTVILGGLRKNEKTASDDRVPYLSNLPFIGPMLFKQIDHDEELTELVVFITPHIVQGDMLVTGDEQQAKILGYREYEPILSDDPTGKP
jgi:type IV pilus assembly protein PilQ